MNSKIKPCQNCKTDFTIEPEDFEFYEKIQVPEPTFCPECRLQRRLSFRNEDRLRKKKDALTGKEIFSLYNEKDLVKVYDFDYWWSDNWDAMDYGQEYDFSVPLFSQIEELKNNVPWASRTLSNVVDCDYCTIGGFLKNCYLAWGSGYSEDCAYICRVASSKDTFDNLSSEGCELCYEGIALINCYQVFYSIHCTDCRNVSFCKNCVDCVDCFGCVNLKHRKYHIFNKEYSKEEYFEQLEGLNLGSFSTVKEAGKRFKEFHFKFPVRFMFGYHNQSVTGNNIYNSKNVLESFMIKNAENLKFCQYLDTKKETKDSYDFTTPGIDTELVYECITVGQGCSRVNFSVNCFPGCQNLEYCMECHSCSDCFACIGLRHKQYCILNRQYTKEEYESLVPKIKQHMNDMPYKDSQGNIYKYGEFFPVELSPFAYNETMAQRHFSLKKEEAIKKGYRWYDKPKSKYKPTIKATNLPDHIKDIDDSILKEVIECDSKQCKGSGVYRIIPQELEFYKKQNLPLPRLCPDCRHHERIKQRNPMKLYERACMKEGCETTFQTTYAPGREEIVWCEKCYQEEVE